MNGVIILAYLFWNEKSLYEIYIQFTAVKWCVNFIKCILISGITKGYCCTEIIDINCAVKTPEKIRIVDLISEGLCSNKYPQIIQRLKVCLPYEVLL